MFKTAYSEMTRLVEDVLSFGYLDFGFVSDFVLRISCFKAGYWNISSAPMMRTAARLMRSG